MLRRKWDIIAEGYPAYSIYYTEYLNNRITKESAHKVFYDLPFRPLNYPIDKNLIIFKIDENNEQINLLKKELEDHAEYLRKYQDIKKYCIF